MNQGLESRARLVLEDGTIFVGKSFGAKISRPGEVVFATGMVGYDLSLTDPSYAGQILTFTYPLIGNWGVPPQVLWESEKIQVAGLAISDLTSKPSHWQSARTIEQWMASENIPGIYDIDTRALTQKLRERGVMLGKIVVEGQDVDFWDPNAENLVEQVSPKELKIHNPINKRMAWAEGVPSSTRSPQDKKLIMEMLKPIELAVTHRTRTSDGTSLRQDPRKIRGGINIALLNCGAKKNILRNLLKRGATVYELPWNFDPFESSGWREWTRDIPRLDGLVISNGPGDPKMVKETISIIKKALGQKLPTFGICLGNQLLALSAGGDTYKLKFGHRAQNQPTIQDGTKRCYITTQNHGFAVDEKKMPAGFKRWFYNANDNTNEGIIHEKLPFFSVQFHPEASPGPTDTEWLFDYFLKRISNYFR